MREWGALFCPVRRPAGGSERGGQLRYDRRADRGAADGRARAAADEPTGGLDQAASLEIMQLLKAFNDVGVTVVIAMHDVAQVSTIAYRTLHIDQQTISTMPAQTAML